MFDTKILPEKIEKLKEKFENGNFADALVGAVNTGNGLMQQRIFTKNEDVLGQTFGTYSKKDADVNVSNVKKKGQQLIGFDVSYGLSPYQKKRAKAGRRVDKKDLEFYGNLRNSIVTAVKDEKSAVIEFNNNEAAKIARGQENQITNIRLGRKATTEGLGVKIFRLNQIEREKVVSQGSELINREMKK